MAEADRLGLAALALTDHHGFYGVVRFAEAARVCGLPTVFGTEVTLAPASPRTGEADPTGTHLVRAGPGSRRATPACRPCWPTRTWRAGRRGSRSSPSTRWPRAAGDHWLVLTGCRKGAVPAALMEAGPRAASREVGRLVERVRARQRRGRAVGPRGPARHGAQRRAGPPGRRVGRRRRGHQQRALRHAGRLPPGHHARRGAGAPPAGRAGGLAALGPGGLPALRRPSRPGASPAGPAWSSGRPSSGAGLRLRPAPGRAAAARLPRPRRAWTSRATCASW